MRKVQLGAIFIVSVAFGVLTTQLATGELHSGIKDFIKVDLKLDDIIQLDKPKLEPQPHQIMSANVGLRRVTDIQAVGEAPASLTLNAASATVLQSGHLQARPSVAVPVPTDSNGSRLGPTHLTIDQQISSVVDTALESGQASYDGVHADTHAVVAELGLRGRSSGYEAAADSGPLTLGVTSEFPVAVQAAEMHSRQLKKTASRPVPEYRLSELDPRGTPGKTKTNAPDPFLPVETTSKIDDPVSTVRRAAEPTANRDGGRGFGRLLDRLGQRLSSEPATPDQPGVRSPAVESRPAAESKSPQTQVASVTKPSSARSSQPSSQATNQATRETTSDEESGEQAQRGVPQEPAVVITRQMAGLQPRIAKTLQFYFDRPLNTRDDSAWSIMHSILGYGPNGQVALNGPKGQRTNAVNWMCWNNPCAGHRLLYLDGNDIRGREGPGFQGHPAQFLAMLAQINLPRDYPIHVNGRALQVEDLINAEMRSCTATQELTFKLISFAHYLKSEAQWTNQQGEVWSLPKLLEIELTQPVNGAACGGTHRMMAISYAVRAKERRGEPLEGVYVRAGKYVRDYQKYAMSLQNRDGSFSSDWFKRRADWGDKDRQLQTTGHLLEWLVFSLPRNELSDPRIVRAVDFLNQLMTRHRYHDWEVGPRGHAIRALALYHQRVFQRQTMDMPIAKR